MHIITTIYEHNSVLRPLFQLKEKGIILLDIVTAETVDEIPLAIEKKINKHTGMIILNAVSNVKGDILPVEKVGKIAKANNIIYIVDGAQGGGHIDLDVKNQNISALCLACHKGLYGIMGSGALLINDDTEIAPVIVGGTGSESFNLMQPPTYPDRLESGTLNLPAIASLAESVRYTQSNMKNFSTLLLSHTEYIINALSTIPKIKIYSSPNPAGIVSFAVGDIPSVDVAEILDSEFDIAVRSGIHCAPLLHQFLGTVDTGLVRVSLSAQNSMREIRFFLNAVKERFGD